MANTIRRILCVAGLSLSVGMNATDNAHNYKAPHWYGDLPACYFGNKVAHSDQDWLSKFDFSFGFGSTHSSWDKNGNSTSVLNETGDYNMLYLFENVVKDPSDINFANFLGNAQVNHARTNDLFGQLRFHGEFELSDFDFTFRQNFKKGFFLEASLPIRDMEIDDIGYTDMSPETGNNGFSQETFFWQQFKNNLDTTLANYDFAPLATSWQKTGIGDLTILLGWEHVWNKDEINPWYGLTFKAGVLFPTGEQSDVNRVFSLPIGYNDHYGFVAYGQLAGGVKHFNARVHGGFTYFWDEQNKDCRMKTFAGQQGYIKLAKGVAEEEKGTLWHVGGDVSFEHLYKGISFRVGYSYTKQEHDELTPADIALFDYAVVNGDSMLEGWHQHTVHFMLDWDFSHFREHADWAPRATVFYDLPFDGENAFKTDIVGGKLGLDIRWKM